MTTQIWSPRAEDLLSLTAVVGWKFTIAGGLRLSQAKTLPDLVLAAVHVTRVCCRPSA